MSAFVESIEFGTNGFPGVTIQRPGWQVVERELRALDGDNSDSVVLDGPKDTYMGVSGGNEGRYVISGWVNGRGSYRYSVGEKTGEQLEVSSCADSAYFDSSEVTDLETVLDVAKRFFESGAVGTSIRWYNLVSDAEAQ